MTRPPVLFSRRWWRIVRLLWRERLRPRGGDVRGFVAGFVAGVGALYAAFCYLLRERPR